MLKHNAQMIVHATYAFFTYKVPRGNLEIDTFRRFADGNSTSREEDLRDAAAERHKWSDGVVRYENKQNRDSRL